MITVAELTEKLKRFDPSMPVATEGCDCVGLSNGNIFIDEIEVGPFIAPAGQPFPEPVRAVVIARDYEWDDTPAKEQV